jgi:hypothetical protein
MLPASTAATKAASSRPGNGSALIAASGTGEP